MPRKKDLDRSISTETRILRTLMPMRMRLPGPAGAIKVDPLPGDLHVQLEITSGAGTGKIFNIEKSMVLLGRVPDVADIVVQDEATSRHHAAIGYKDEQFTLYDLGSTNGTTVAGQSVVASTLQNGDLIGIGDTVITFRLVNKPAS
ncbi:MAG: FHA domain-containing protein [Myxococcota bacterium]